jgi:hypothetical protein
LRFSGKAIKFNTLTKKASLLAQRWLFKDRNMMVVPPSNSSDEHAEARATIFPPSLYTYHDVLIEPGYRLKDSEGSRAFVRFAKKYSCSLMATISFEEVVCIVATLMEIWNEWNRGRFLERPPAGSNEESEWVEVLELPPAGSNEESEWVEASKTAVTTVAVKTFVGLRKVAKKLGPTGPLLLVNPADETVIDAFWKDNNDAVAAAI